MGERERCYNGVRFTSLKGGHVPPFAYLQEAELPSASGGRVTFLCWPKEKSPKERACDQTSAAWRSVPGLFEGTSLSHRKAAAIVAAALRVRVFSRRACSSKVKGKDKNHEKAKRGQRAFSFELRCDLSAHAGKNP